MSTKIETITDSLYSITREKPSQELFLKQLQPNNFTLLLLGYSTALNKMRIPTYFLEAPREDPFTIKDAIAGRQALEQELTGVNNSPNQLFDILHEAKQHDYQVRAIGPTYRELKRAKLQSKKWFHTVGKKWWHISNKHKNFSQFIAQTQVQTYKQLGLEDTRSLMIGDSRSIDNFIELYKHK